MDTNLDITRPRTGYLLKRRVLVTLRDPRGVVVEAEAFDVRLSGDADNPGDPDAQLRIAEYVGAFVGAMGGEGMGCSVTIEQVCTFPGCDAPTNTLTNLCDPCAEATL